MVSAVLGAFQKGYGDFDGVSIGGGRLRGVSIHFSGVTRGFNLFLEGSQEFKGVQGYFKWITEFSIV